jgi:phospholipid/cholesterol/gamma-HCH transport system ATP-binding protein
VKPVIEVSDIHTRFGKLVVHNGVNLQVNRGELVALIGGSGSGKSVLLRQMVGLLKPAQGQVKVLGTDMWAGERHRIALTQRRFGMMYQEGALFSSLTVAHNVATPLKEHANIPKDMLWPLVNLRLSQAGLTADVGNQMPSELSGGMKKRAALARALALEPEILFLDEPTSGLDPITARAFDRLIRFLCDDLGITVLMITHDLDTLHGIVDRLIVLGDGKTLVTGTLNDVIAVDDPWINEYFDDRPVKQ